VKLGEWRLEGCCLSLILLDLCSEFFTKETSEGSGDFKIGGQVIHTVKYVEDLQLLAREEAVLQGMTERLNEIGRC